MQLDLAFLDEPDPLPNPSSAASSAWYHRSLADGGARDPRTPDRPHAHDTAGDGGKR